MEDQKHFKKPKAKFNALKITVLPLGDTIQATQEQLTLQHHDSFIYVCVTSLSYNECEYK